MVKQSEVSGSESSWSKPRTASSGGGKIIAGFGLLVVILIAAAVGSAWQASVHRSDQNEAESHSSTATLLQDVGDQAQAAAGLLQQYVATGDDSLIPQIQSRSTAAIESLTGAITAGGDASLNDVAVRGAGLAEGAGQVIALRQSGDVQGAAAAMEGISPAFVEFTAGLDEAISLELGEVTALQSSADTAGDISTWLLIVSLAAAGTLGLATAALFARSIMRRRVPKTASPM